MPLITNNNYCNIELFINDNIDEFNRNSKSFEYNKIIKEYKNNGFDDIYPITATEIRKKLNENYQIIIDDSTRKGALENDLKQMTATTLKDGKEEMIAIAKAYVVNIKHVENHYKSMIRKAVIEGFENDREDWEDKTVNLLKAYADSISINASGLPGKFINKDYRTSISQVEYLLLNTGFCQNLTNEVKGQDVANQGDSAQFIFVGRAILAGFNCSNVDVRSSSYDAIISRPNSNGKAASLKTVQIKGITTKSQLSLRKRARGGSGSQQEGRNRSVPLSPDDADLLVAVDKQFGTCYIIPMSEVESKIINGEENISWAELEANYKEKWENVAL